MAARRSTLEPLAANGSRRAQVCLDALEQMGSLLACAQLGITVCSVLLGAISEAALHHALEPVVHHLGLPTEVTDGLALALALLIVVYLHVVVGEMIPKNLALAGPERAGTVVVRVTSPVGAPAGLFGSWANIKSVVKMQTAPTNAYNQTLMLPPNLPLLSFLETVSAVDRNAVLIVVAQQ